MGQVLSIDAAKDESEMQAEVPCFSPVNSPNSSLPHRDLRTLIGHLQEEVSELSLELSERNAALNTSLADNERMRLALQHIVDSMPCGVLVLERDGEISMINPESKRLLGLERAQFGEGCKTTLRQISASSGVNLEASCQGKSISDTGRRSVFKAYQGRGGSRSAIAGSSISPTVQAVPDQTILILRDITAQKRSEKEREAGRKAMALAEIATILAHEIRNPLASLELFAELIEQDAARRGEWISNLRAGIRSLSGTVNNVLCFHGSGSMKLAPVALSTLIGKALRFVQPWRTRQLLHWNCLAERDTILVMGNESALQQVVLNLFRTLFVIRKLAEGYCVVPEHRIARGENHGNMSVEFADTGCGMRPDQIAHIFEPGFSGSGDTSGLGLAVCARIMKQHGGRICVSNRIHCGARFTLSLPLLNRKPVQHEQHSFSERKLLRARG